MPTIDQLDAAAASADTDEFPASQSGVARKVTRAQIVAGLQPTLAVPQASLLGRNSAGTGAPERVALGAGLSLAGGVLSAVPPVQAFSTLPSAGPPGGGDLVPLGQNGQNMALPYAQFMAGLSGLAGVGGSGLVALPSGATASRRLADLFADSVAVESFGAHGDGVTDDTAAFVAAVASGRPVRLGHATYVVNGQWTITQPGTVLLGTPGLSVLRRASQSGGAWIAIQADGFRAEGVVFDANNAAVTLESWGVQVGTQCLTSDFHRCAFLNASGPTLGCGLVFLATDPVMCRHVVRDCEFAGNAAHGVWVQACDGVLVAECRAHNNAGYGICVDYNDPTFKQQAHLVQVIGNRCWGNDRGIGIGNFNATNTTPPVWGHANPDVLMVLVSGNLCHDNASYGIAVSGWGLVVQDNLLCNNGLASLSGAGLLANADHSRIIGNTVTGAPGFGIDAGGGEHGHTGQYRRELRRQHQPAGGWQRDPGLHFLGRGRGERGGGRERPEFRHCLPGAGIDRQLDRHAGQLGRRHPAPQRAPGRAGGAQLLRRWRGEQLPVGTHRLGYRRRQPLELRVAIGLQPE